MMPVDPTELNRLRWRCRRGLLELDIILSRYLVEYAQSISQADARELMVLLELPENELLYIVTGRSENYRARARRFVQQLRAA